MGRQQNTTHESINLLLIYIRPYFLKKIFKSFFDKNVVFLAQAKYSYFSADFRLEIFLYYS